MTEAEVITIIRAYLDGLFPKFCHCCGRRYANLRDYLLNTKHLGDVMSFDADAGDWQPEKPIGTLTFAQCPCGNTLALGSEGLPLPVHWRLLSWARAETCKRRQTPTQLLNYLREEICRQVLAEPPPSD